MEERGLAKDVEAVNKEEVRNYVAISLIVYMADARFYKTFEERLRASTAVFVEDTSKKDPLPKMPGGRPEPEDGGCIYKTAAREVRQEAGLHDVEFMRDKRLVEHVVKPDYDIYFIIGSTNTDPATLPKQGDENGAITYVHTDHTVGEVIDKKFFILPPHYRGFHALYTSLVELMRQAEEASA